VPNPSLAAAERAEQLDEIRSAAFMSGVTHSTKSQRSMIV